MTSLRQTCEEYLTAGGANGRRQILDTFFECTDADLATELLNGWFDEQDANGEIYNSGQPSYAEAEAMFADLRQDLDWLEAYDSSLLGHRPETI